MVSFGLRARAKQSRDAPKYRRERHGEANTFLAMLVCMFGLFFKFVCVHFVSVKIYQLSFPPWYSMPAQKFESSVHLDMVRNIVIFQDADGAVHFQDSQRHVRNAFHAMFAQCAM